MAYVGEYSFYLSLITPVNLLASLHLRNFFNSSHDNSIKNSDIFFTRLIFSFIFLIVVLPFAFFLDNELSVIPFLILIMSKFFDMFSEVVYAIKQKENQLEYVGKSLVFKSLATVCFVLLCRFFDFGFNILILSVLLSSFLFSLIDISSIKNCIQLPISKHKIAKIVRLSLPLGIVALTTSANVNVPRYVLKLHLGVQEVGIFTSIFFFYASTMIIANAIIQSFLNQVSKASQTKTLSLSSLKKYFIVTLLISLVFILGNFLIGHFFYTVIYGEQKDFHSYMSHLNYLIPLGLIATKYNYMMMAQNLYKRLLLTSSLSLLIHFFISDQLIQSNQLPGAFHALAFSLVVGIALNFLSVFFRVRENGY